MVLALLHHDQRGQSVNLAQGHPYDQVVECLPEHHHRAFETLLGLSSPHLFVQRFFASRYQHVTRDALSTHMYLQGRECHSISSSELYRWLVTSCNLPLAVLSDVEQGWR